MKHLLVATASLIAFRSSAHASTFGCEVKAIEAGQAFAVLNQDPTRLVIQRASADTLTISGDEIRGVRYFLRSPAGDLNYCSVFIVKQSSSCQVLEVSATGN